VPLGYDWLALGVRPILRTDERRFARFARRYADAVIIITHMEADLASLELLQAQLRDLRARIEPLRARKKRLEEDLLLSRLAVQAIKSRSEEGARSVMVVRDIMALES